MNIIIASIVLGLIALVALYWPKSKAGKGEILVRLYKDDALLVTRSCECDTLHLSGKMVVTRVYMPDMKRTVSVNRVTYAFPGFEDKEAEASDLDPFTVNKGESLTIEPKPGEPGVLTIT